MAIRIDTTKYEAVHGRTPRQPSGYQTSPWAFQIDQEPRPVFLVGRYSDALKRAKRRARYSVTVLP